MRVVSGDDVRRLVPMHDAIAAVREVFIATAQGEFAPIPRIGAPSQSLFVMLAERFDRSGVRCGQSAKVVTYNEGNPSAGRPMVQGVVLWFDGETGEATQAIDGATVTSLRTGAASGVATDLFASPDASVLAMIGTGPIAHDQIRAVCAVRPIRSISIAGRDVQKAQALALAMSTEFPEAAVRGVADAREAVAGADIICTATTARAPLFGIREIKRDVHINAVGSFSPSMWELDSDVIGEARLVCVDDLAAIQDTGDLRNAIAAKSLTAGAASLIGTALKEETLPMQGGITVFKSIGIAAQDWAIAQRVDDALKARALR